MVRATLPAVGQITLKDIPPQGMLRYSSELVKSELATKEALLAMVPRPQFLHLLIGVTNTSSFHPAIKFQGFMLTV